MVIVTSSSSSPVKTAVSAPLALSSQVKISMHALRDGLGVVPMPLASVVDAVTVRYTFGASRPGHPLFSATDLPFRSD
jgi:hypothetical protein